MENKVISIGLEGMRGYPVVAEANVRDDKEACVIIGLPDASMKESKERILSCLHELEIDVSMKKITIHLSPADQRKTGTGHDCAMLVSVLQEMLDDLAQLSEGTCFIAALTLSGNLTPFYGIIPAIQQALELGYKQIVIPPIDLGFLNESHAESFIRIQSLEELIIYLRGQQSFDLVNHRLIPLNRNEPVASENLNQTDFSHIRGLQDAKRVLEIAAAGGHHVLLHGPPGCGKSMLADAFHTIFPDLDQDKILENYSIYELAREQSDAPHRPPYRHPHHSASAVSLIGGGTFPKPGEISLAHHGILFLDELGEFPKKALDMLRQPMETGEVTISRVRQTVHYPSRFTLIAATNPCPCGYYGSNERYCTCTPRQVRAYQLKVSGPLFDRIDFIIQLKSTGLNHGSTEETSAVIKERVRKARMIQVKRYGQGGLNGTVAMAKLMKESNMTSSLQRKIKDICYNKKWSNRTQAKLIRMARTIADLAEQKEVTEKSLKEAIKWKDLSVMYQDSTQGVTNGET